MKNSFGYDKSELRIKDPKSCGKEMRRKICINPQNESHIEKCYANTVARNAKRISGTIEIQEKNKPNG